MINAVSDFPEEKFNSKKTVKSWSAGEICEHIIILETYISHFLKGRTVPAGRDPENNINIIKSAYQDSGIKYNAPEAIAPKTVEWDKSIILSKLEKLREKMRDAVNSDELTKLCLDFPHPKFGELTVIEWIYFSIYHSQRHLNQINELKNQVN